MAKEYAFDYQRYSAGQTAVNPYPVRETEEQALPKIRKRAKSKSRVNGILTAVLIAAVFVVVFRYTLINEMNSNNTKLENQLHEVTTQTDMAQLSLDRTTDLKYVETVAKDKLGMDFPQSHQIINVTLEYPDKAVTASGGKTNVFTTVKNFFGGMLEYLY